MLLPIQIVRMIFYYVCQFYIVCLTRKAHCELTAFYPLILISFRPYFTRISSPNLFQLTIPNCQSQHAMGVRLQGEVRFVVRSISMFLWRNRWSTLHYQCIMLQGCLTSNPKGTNCNLSHTRARATGKLPFSSIELIQPTLA